MTGNVVKKIKEYNYFVKYENIVIRSIKNSDLSFWKDWIRNGMSNDELLKYININRKSQILIIEINNKPIGEISILLDKELIITNKDFKKPYYLIYINVYEKYTDNDINNTIKLLINSWKIFKLRKGTFYTKIDESNEPEIQNFQRNFFENGFEDIPKEQYDYNDKFKEITISLGAEKMLFQYNQCKIIIRR